MLLRKRYLWACALGLCCILLVSCSADKTASSAQVWIDVPLDGLALVALNPVEIKGHAASTDGFNRVDIFINDDLTYALENLSIQGNLAHFQVSWTPPHLGEYIIKAVVYGGASNPGTSDSAQISFARQPEVSSVTSPTQQNTPTIPAATTPTQLPPTATETPEKSVRFWADPPTIQAGACTTLYWQVENVQQVIFGGLQQPFEGSYRDCFCTSQRYTLTVIDNNGQEEKYPLDITVTGSCITPTVPIPATATPSLPPQDLTPPPPPTPFVPSNGLVLACRGNQDLGWLPVEDPSGISEYQVQVQRHAGDNNWQDISGSVFTGIQTKDLTIPVECAWYYRWRVRAVDGAGNIGAWSIWFTFTITFG